MAFVSLTWSDYLKDVEHFLKISKQLGDFWELFKKDDKEGNTFLIYKKKVKSKLVNSQALSEDRLEDDSISSDSALGSATEILQLEYHIVYSISYQVPVLYLRIYHCDGSLADLEAIWSVFCDSQAKTRSEMLSILTPMEHPVLFKPYYGIHPCRTAELLAQMPSSSNYILTFISLIGPYVQLHLDNKYGLTEAT